MNSSAPTTRNRIARWSVMVAAFLGVAAHVPAGPAGSAELAAAAQSAARIVVIRSKEAEPYRQAEEALTAALGPSLRATMKSCLLTEAQTVLAGIGRGDVVFALGTEAAQRAAGMVGPDVAVVCAMVADPEGAGLTGKSNVSGVSTVIPVKEQIELIEKVLPQARKVGVLRRAGSDRGKRATASIEAALPAGWSVETVTIEEGSAIADSVNQLLDRNPDVIWTYPDSTLFDGGTIKALLLNSLRKRIPVFGFSPAFVRSGALFGVVIEPESQGRQAAELVRAALEGLGRSGFQPPAFGIAINTVIAERTETVIPEQLVKQAQTVFRGE